MNGGGPKRGIIAGDPRPRVLDSSVSFNENVPYPTGCDEDDGISWIKDRWDDNDYCGNKNDLTGRGNEEDCGDSPPDFLYTSYEEDYELWQGCKENEKKAKKCFAAK